MTKVFEKCRNYARIGIPQIFVFDPESKTAWEWSRETDNLERIQTLQLGNGAILDVNRIWAEMDAQNIQERSRAKTGALNASSQNPNEITTSS